MQLLKDYRKLVIKENSTIKTANVYLSKIHKPNGKTFVMKIIDADLDVFIYKGFMQGSFDK